MMERIDDLPETVIGFRGRGEITDSDYENVLIPAVEEMLARCGKIRLLYQLGDDFSGFSPLALWDDAKVGLTHYAAWERVAVVTDVGWIRMAISAFGFFMPGRVRMFGNDEFSAAQMWLSE